MGRSPDPKKVVEKYENRQMSRTAGEVRFVKDRSGDKSEWGWGQPGPSERANLVDFEFNSKHLKPLAKALRAALSAMGHSMSAYTVFNRIKARDISPDGNLGGKGYIQKIPDMRRQLVNVNEALSAFSDTIYDEINAAHWNPANPLQPSRMREEVLEIMEDVEEIKDSPEVWAEGEADKGRDRSKKASRGDALNEVEDVLSRYPNDWVVMLERGEMLVGPSVYEYEDTEGNLSGDLIPVDEKKLKKILRKNNLDQLVDVERTRDRDFYRIAPKGGRN